MCPYPKNNRIPWSISTGTKTFHDRSGEHAQHVLTAKDTWVRVRQHRMVDDCRDLGQEKKGNGKAFYPLTPSAAEISARAAFSGSLTATPCSFEASATFRPMARIHFL